MSQLVYGILTLAICYVIACRIDKMVKGHTKPTIFWQHAILGMAVFASWVIGFTSYAQWSESIAALGVLQFFAFSVNRWRYEAPKGTALPELSTDQLKHVVGGTKK